MSVAFEQVFGHPEMCFMAPETPCAGMIQGWHVHGDSSILIWSCSEHFASVHRIVEAANMVREEQA